MRNGQWLSFFCDSERTRTSNLLIRSQMLYPLSYGAQPLFRAAKIKWRAAIAQAFFHFFINFTERQASFRPKERMYTPIGRSEMVFLQILPENGAGVNVSS
jgi:hypothetical protein